MAKKFLGFITKKPLIWFHYLPLVGVVILAYFISKWLGLMDLVESNSGLGWTLLVALYYVLLLIGDQLIHKIIGED